MTGSGDRVDYKAQIQLRFCVRDMSYRQSDKFPSRVNVKVNNAAVQLPVGSTFLQFLASVDADVLGMFADVIFSIYFTFCAADITFWWVLDYWCT